MPRRSHEPASPVVTCAAIRAVVEESGSHRFAASTCTAQSASEGSPRRVSSRCFVISAGASHRRKTIGTPQSRAHRRTSATALRFRNWRRRGRARRRTAALRPGGDIRRTCACPLRRVEPLREARAARGATVPGQFLADHVRANHAHCSAARRAASVDLPVPGRASDQNETGSIPRLIEGAEGLQPMPPGVDRATGRGRPAGSASHRAASRRLWPARQPGKRRRAAAGPGLRRPPRPRNMPGRTRTTAHRP